ncbi:MAG: DUF4937 domain-containing protein, partial [Ignavibacteriae bacterium]|nr:DUF4937 domain-containing protein [Ignavibacteriota bacterium]
MCLKWIVCEVENEFRAAFSKAQEEWVDTKNTKGFIAQIGGWDINNSNEACILAFWEDQN